MTNLQIKDWLDWFAKNFNYSFSTIGDLYKRDSWGIYAFKVSYGYVVEEAFQLVLQEEIQILGLRFELNTYNGKPLVEIGRNEHERLASCEADTILGAFMLSFREAWEAIHG